MENQESYYATGRRKTATARTWIKPGTGTVTVNGRTMESYFGVKTDQTMLLEPFKLTNNENAYDVIVTVRGGGRHGQAGAARHGITRALIEVDPEFRAVLKKAGFVKRDPRQKERKKYGQKGARARFQFSKR